MSTIAIIIPFFGEWPHWIELFFDSCRRNCSIDFLFYTDCEIPPYKESETNNLHFTEISFTDYCQMVSKRIGLQFAPNNPYKLCDLKPFLGYIHERDIQNFDFWGWGDLDLIWGNIRDFYTEHLLQQYDIISTHADRLSGHLTLIRNNKYYRNIAFKIRNWKTFLSSDRNMHWTR